MKKYDVFIIFHTGQTPTVGLDIAKGPGVNFCLFPCIRNPLPCHAMPRPLVPACVHSVQAHARAGGLERESRVEAGAGHRLLGEPPYPVLRHWRGEREWSILVDIFTEQVMFYDTAW